MNGRRDDLSAGEMLGEFRILKPIGRGGMGVVYLARDERLDRRVALKAIAPHLAADEEFRERFIAEARSAAAIEHENVVPVYSAGVADGVLYMAMRYIDGTDLRTVLAESGPLGSEEAAAIVADVAAGLDAAHAAGLVHRDVKPANILLRGEPGNRTGYLVDFGLTKGGASSPDSLTATGRWVGTIDYVAPEQIESGQVDARTDVYALGCVLYEALTGSVPFAGNDMQKMWAHVHEPFPSLARAGLGDLRLTAAIARATAKAPDDRFASAGELARAAAAGLRGKGAGAAPAAAGIPPAAAARRPSGDPSQAPTVPAGERSQPTAPRARPMPGSNAAAGSLRTGVTIGGAVVVAAGLIAAAVVVAGGELSTGASKPKDGTERTSIRDRTASDPALPANATECEPDVYVEERVEGAPYTSCPFAREVGRAYRSRGEGNAITAYSPVTGTAYDMTCEGAETVRCSDDKTAIVYLTAPFGANEGRQDEDDLGEWPGGSGYSAMLGAFSSEWRARDRQQEASAKGLDAGVLYSSSFSSLRPGYWVVFSGTFASSGEAAKRARRARALGYSDSYPRFVSP